MECPWTYRVSYKNTSKRSTKDKGFILTVKSTSHYDDDGPTHPLALNLLVYKRHRDRLKEYQVLKTQAGAHRVSVLPYTLSR